ncbi:hypothetical protein PMAYCL1PPCAC_20927 [Pristionchus mayeri]|uniref:MD-2-related lipid-recognition domain-containing protein n=1 Tax=Pristionchus mayeri TaxID=1317129 RepID=A0AAN5CUB8_9BILA|nr:hypothetical protein PMAYCL1PPCAC_20927 [Pristionchus mayeri]
MRLTLVLLISLALFAALTDARPKKHHHHGIHRNELDEDEESRFSKEEKGGKTSLYQKLSKIRRSTYPMYFRNLPIYFSIGEDSRKMPFVMDEITTNVRGNLMPAGALRFKGLVLLNTAIDQIRLKFRTRRNTTFLDASLKLQLETAEANSAIRTIYLDNIEDICPRKDHLSKHVCPMTSYSDDAFSIGAIPLPYFEEVEMTSDEIGTIHIWIEDELEEHLLDTRIFVSNNDKDRDDS